MYPCSKAKLVLSVHFGQCIAKLGQTNFGQGEAKLTLRINLGHFAYQSQSYGPTLAKAEPSWVPLFSWEPLLGQISVKMEPSWPRTGLAQYVRL